MSVVKTAVMAVIIGVAAVAMGTGASKNKANASDLVEVDAEIFSIDRKCSFQITEKNVDTGKVKKVSHEDADCSSDAKFTEFKNPATRPYKVQGNATFKLIYKSPVDGSSQTGTVSYDGGDDEFYSFNAHDKIKVRVSKSDPTLVEKVERQG